MRSILLFSLLTLAGLSCLPTCSFAQYELDEMAVHAGGGLRYLNGQAGNFIGPGAHAQVSFTHYPCGKPFAIEGRAGLNFGRASSDNGSLATGLPSAGKTSLSWAGGELAAAFKIRLHDYHRPREFAFLIGPKVYLPLIARYASSIGSGPASDVDLKVNRISAAAFLAVQFRRPAPDKKFWFIEPGLEFTPMPLFRREDGNNLSCLYAYLQFAFAFWDQRG